MKYFILLILFSAANLAAQVNGFNNNNPTFLPRGVSYHNNSINHFSAVDSQSALTKVGQWGWGPCYDVAIKESYAYIGNGYVFQVLDVSNPASPKIVGQLSMEYPINRLVVSGNYAYTISPFSIIDISNPANPVLVSTYNLSTSDGPSAITVKGNYAYLGDFIGWVFIIDISNPLNPKEIKRMPTNGEDVEYLAVKDSALYASPSDNSVNIYNIAKPDSSFLITLYTIPVIDAPLTIAGNYLYMGGGAYGGKFQIYDIRDSDLFNLSLVNEVYIDSQNTYGSQFTSISVSDTIAYVAVEIDTIPYISQLSQILAEVDIADTNNIHVVSKVKNPYGNEDIDVDGQLFAGSTVNLPYGYFTSSTGLWTVNLENHDSIKSVSIFSTGWYINNITVDSSYHAYVAELSGGLKILDFSEPSTPKQIGYYLTDEQVIDAAVSGNYAYLDCDSDLQILDISNLASPKLISRVFFNDDIIRINLVGNFDFLCIDGSTVYAARKSQKLFTIDVSDPVNPKIITTDSLTGLPVGISQSNGYIYVADRDLSYPNPNSGVQIFNISNPDIPVESGFLKVTDLGGLTVYKNSLFVMEGDTALKEYGLGKYDITNPTKPVFKYFAYVPGSFAVPITIKADNDYAYLGNMDVISISNPDSGKLVYMGNGGTAVAVYKDIVLFGDIEVSIFNNILTSIKDIHYLLPNNFELFQNYPNPFNPSTAISYQLSAVSYVKLKVYNILGQEIETLVNSLQQQGKYIVLFDASKLSSGIYFYRLEADGSNGKRYVSVKKMELLK